MQAARQGQVPRLYAARSSRKQSVQPTLAYGKPLAPLHKILELLIVQLNYKIIFRKRNFVPVVSYQELSLVGR